MITLSELTPIGNGRILLNRYNYSGLLEQQPVLDFCQRNGIDVTFLEILWNGFNTESDLDVKHLRNFKLEVVLDYLEKTHRYYLDKLVPEIDQALLTQLKMQTINEDLAFRAYDLFCLYRIKLGQHIADEEKRFFAYARKLQSNQYENHNYSTNEFLKEHLHHEDDLGLLIQLLSEESTLNQFPGIVLINKIRLLMRDLKIHALVEDEVLVPIVRRMENTSDLRC